MPAIKPKNLFDVFVSYNHADSDWVESWLVPCLKNAGLTVCTDYESFEIGVPALINMENAITASRHTLLVLTPTYLGSQWALYEQILTQAQDPIGLRQRTIPVLRQSCKLPKRISMLTCADLTGKRNEETEISKIIRALKGDYGISAAPVARQSGSAPPTPAPSVLSAQPVASANAVINDPSQIGVPMYDVLVIDDSETWRSIVAEALDGICTCDLVSDIKSALHKIRSRQHKVVCMNWKIGSEFGSEYNGLKCLTLLRNEYSDVPVVLMSGELEGRILRLKAENPNIREILIKGKESEPDRRMDSRFVEDLLSTVPSLCAGHLPVHSVVSPGPIVLRERRRKTISWLHISDLHFHPPEYEADTILQDMVADIKTQVTRNDLRIDFIVVTGDITFSGQWKQYCRAINFFDAVLDATGAQKERLLIVPGNHDVHWASIEETLAAGYLARLTRTTDVDTVLGLPHERRDILRKLPHYRRFIDKYMVNTSGEKLRPCDYRRFFFVETMVIADKRVSVLGLNSAWMSAYKWKPSKEKQIADDRHNLILGNWQLREALKEAKQNNSDIVIAAMHHPTEWLKDDIDRPIIEDLLERNCPFVLQGHLHETQVIGKAGPTGKMLTITAGASFQRRQDAIGYNGYNIVQLDLDGGVGTVFIRCYSPKRAGFWTADTFSYPNTPEGRYTFTLPDSLL